MNLLKTNYKSDNVISIFQTFTNFNKIKNYARAKFQKSLKNGSRLPLHKIGRAHV